VSTSEHRRGYLAETASAIRRSALILVATLGLILAGLGPAAARYAAIITDADTGAVLYEDNADAPRRPASLTKVMTLYLLFEALDSNRLKLTSQLQVSARAAAQEPTKLGLRAGDTITAREVILGLVTKSANDAAVVAAETLGGTEERFAQIMTERARRLGMTGTVFRNASGLPDPRQISTARDLAILARAVIKTYPHHYHFFSERDFTYHGITHANHNRLNNWYAGADGLKTGYIRASGFNLVTSAQRDNRRLIGVVMGGISPGSRDQEMARLLDASFARPDGEPVIRHARAEKRTAKPTKIVEASAPTAEPPSAAAKKSAGWGIQVGAFAQVEPARRAAERAVKLARKHLVSATVELAPLQKKSGSVYRARLVGIAEGDARKACKLLQKQKMDCVPLTPAELRNGVKVAAATLD
jgi:D-alanyl-D-alanine carboxypeptidase